MPDVSGAYDKNKAYLKLYLNSHVRINMTVLDYHWISMLAEVGGYTGLLLGIAVINITAYTERILLSFVRSKNCVSKKVNQNALK